MYFTSLSSVSTSDFEQGNANRYGFPCFRMAAVISK